MKVLTVFGTRPEAIKLAPVIRELERHQDFSLKVCVTAQHRQMLDQVLELFEIKPDWDLDLMLPDQSLFQITSRGLGVLERVLREEQPEVVLVQGDTTTTFVAALAAYYLRIKVGHVEAGLRTHDKFSPFPEEINRKLCDALSDLLFAPTEVARKNLLHEGILEEKVFVTGNTVIDALLWTAQRQEKLEIQDRFKRKFASEYGLKLEGKRLILVTGHRRESFERFEEICHGLGMIAE
ncbi:MAG: non-hydrolyzing UDP-N-acetylglucosamine 2-epimerase, partial [Candidatus Bipolaricaulia bacterium]